MQEGVSPLGAERPRAEGLQGEALKKSNEGVDFGAKRSETLIYIYFIYMFNNIFSTSDSLRAPRVSKVYE